MSLISLHNYIYFCNFFRLLFRIFGCQGKCPPFASTLAPSQIDFVDKLLPQLAILIQESGNGGLVSSDISPSDHHASPPDLGSVTRNDGQSCSAITLPSTLVCPTISSESSCMQLQEALLGHLDQPNNRDSSSSGSLNEKMHLNTGVDDNSLFKCKSLNNDNHPSISSLSISSNGDSEDRKTALRLMNTVCKFLLCKATHVETVIAPEIYK